MAPNEKIKQPITLAREAAGLTQQDLAYELGVSIKTLSMWEAGHRWPRAQVVIDAADLLGVTTDYLFGRPNPGPPPLGGRSRRADRSP